MIRHGVFDLAVAISGPFLKKCAGRVFPAEIGRECLLKCSTEEHGSAGVFHTGDFLYSPWGVLLAEITFYTPFVLRPALAAFGQVPAAQLDVAASLGAAAWFARFVSAALAHDDWVGTGICADRARV